MNDKGNTDAANAGRYTAGFVGYYYNGSGRNLILSNLVNYINTHKTNPYAKLAWHMTWAYQQDCKHHLFKNYNEDQTTMYNAIINTTKEKVIPTNKFDYIIL